MVKEKFNLLGLDGSLSEGKVKSWRFCKKGDSKQDFKKPPFYIFSVILFLILVIFLGRLFSLTIISGEENRSLAENNRVKLVEVEAKRGQILDRDGQMLAQSQRLYFLTKGSKVSQISESQVKDMEAKGLASENFEGELGRISQEIERNYSLSEITAHILGYVSGVQEEDLGQNPSISSSVPIGRLGVEASYDDFLRGKNGKKLIEVDASGKKVSILGEENSQDGRSINLTIDTSLQKVAFEALKKQADKIGSGRAALIAQNPKTGEVLALVSLPSFDPKNVGKFMADEKKPLFNRVDQGTYPPGSIFKIVSALAGLESGKITKDTEIEDVGEFFLGNTKFTNWFYRSYGGKDGVLKIDRAIARSNDIFFYKLAQTVGLDPIREMALKLGFGNKTGIDLPSESSGLVPDDVWKRSTYGESWYPGDTMHLGIGQGFMLATPIQISSLTSYVASAKLTRPYLVSKIGGQEGSAGSTSKVESIEMETKTLGENLVKIANLKLVREGMRQACQEKGTGWPFFNAPYKVGCKTGTAEKELGDPHAWFTVFAPYDDPQLALTVIIEDGGEGSSVAGPVAREILDWWFKNK